MPFAPPCATLLPKDKGGIFHDTLLPSPPGTGPVQEIERYAQIHHIAAGVVLSGVGCLTRWEVRDASGVRVRSGKEPVEIVSLTGTVAETGCHLHISLSREDLSVLGGHLRPGCLVNTTAEIVLLELEGTAFSREPDPDTGYDELVIRQI